MLEAPACKEIQRKISNKAAHNYHQQYDNSRHNIRPAFRHLKNPNHTNNGCNYTYYNYGDGRPLTWRGTTILLR